MTEGDALVYVYLLDGKGGGEVVGWPAIDKWDSSQGCFGYIWIRKCLKPEFGWKTKVDSAR